MFGLVDRRGGRGSASLATVCVGLVLTHCKFDVVFGSRSTPDSRSRSKDSLPGFSSMQCGCDWVQESIVFSTLSKFPSRINATMAGSIHEGELGYILYAVFEAIVDNLGLVVPVVIGDGRFVLGPQPCTWLSTSTQSQANHMYASAPTYVQNHRSERTCRRSTRHSHKRLQNQRRRQGNRHLVCQVRASSSSHQHDLDWIDESVASSLQWTVAAIHSV